MVANRPSFVAQRAMPRHLTVREIRVPKRRNRKSGFVEQRNSGTFGPVVSGRRGARMPGQHGCFLGAAVILTDRRFAISFSASVGQTEAA